jgi:hypothetical protein
MITLALALILTQHELEPAAVVPDSWARCEDGGYADLRPDIPLIVLTGNEGSDVAGGWSPPYDTGFVLYADGRLIARRWMALFEWRLTARQRDALWKILGAEELLALPDHHDVVTSRQREAFGRWYHGPALPQTELSLWKDGCRKRIVIRGLSAILLSWELTGHIRGRRGRLLQVQREEARMALKALPPALARAIRHMMTRRPAPAGKLWCDFARCFDRARMLVHQELWSDAEDDPLAGRILGGRQKSATPPSFPTPSPF